MLWRTQDLKGSAIRAIDGEIGLVRDLYLDDTDWTIRYLAVDTGVWLAGRQVLISPEVAKVNEMKPGVLPVTLSIAQVANSPDANPTAPNFERQRRNLDRHYGWGGYGYHIGEALSDLAKGDASAPAGGDRPSEAASSLHSTLEMITARYNIQATDGEIGRVEEFLIDPHRWAIVYMLANTRTWLPGRSVLISPRRIGRVNWTRMKVHVEMTRQQVMESPRYDPKQPPGLEEAAFQPRDTSPADLDASQS